MPNVVQDAPVISGGGGSLSRLYPFWENITKGQTVEIFNDAGTAKVRRLVQPIPGIGSSSNYLNVFNGNGNWKGGVVHNHGNGGFGSVTAIAMNDQGQTSLNTYSAAIGSNFTLSSITTGSITGWQANFYDYVRSYSNGNAADPRILIIGRVTNGSTVHWSGSCSAAGAFNAAGSFPTWLNSNGRDVEATMSGNPNKWLTIFANATSNAQICVYTGNANSNSGGTSAPGDCQGAIGNAVNIKYVDTDTVTGITRFVYAKYQTGGTYIGLGTYNINTDALTLVNGALITQTCTIKGMGILGTLSTSSDIWVAMPDASGGQCHAIRIIAGTGVTTYQTSFTPSSGSVVPSNHWIANHVSLDQFKVLAFVQDGTNQQSWQRSEVLFNPNTLVATLTVAPAILLGGGAFSVGNHQFFAKDGPKAGAIAAFLKPHANSPAAGNNNFPVGATGTGVTVNVMGVYAGIAAETGTAGQSKLVALHGGVVDGLAGFNTPGARVYLDPNTSSLTTTATGYDAGRVLGVGEVYVRTP